MSNRPRLFAAVATRLTELRTTTLHDVPLLIAAPVRTRQVAHQPSAVYHGQD